MSEFAIFSKSFVALDSGTGPISVPGLKVGDKMIWCLQTPPPGQGNVGFVLPQSQFEAIISVADEIQQIANLGVTGTFTEDAIFVRGV